MVGCPSLAFLCRLEDGGQQPGETGLQIVPAQGDETVDAFRAGERDAGLAPDLPGFGFSKAPPSSAFAYTFQHLTEVVEAFTEQLGLKRYALDVFDYGAPVGFRLAMAHPERVTAIVSENGNAYEEGLGPGWALWRAYWKEPTPEHREAAQLDLFLDYRTNVALYPAFQAYFRKARPPLLAIWGRHDPIFLPAGAEAFRRDLPAAEVRLLDVGHFALETEAEAVRAFLGQVLGEPSR